VSKVFNSHSFSSEREDNIEYSSIVALIVTLCSYWIRSTYTSGSCLHLLYQYLYRVYVCYSSCLQTVSRHVTPRVCRPYHAMLLLVEVRSLIKQLPTDSSPALVRLLRVYSAKKNLQELAADSDLELSQVCDVSSP